MNERKNNKKKNNKRNSIPERDPLPRTPDKSGLERGVSPARLKRTVEAQDLKTHREGCTPPTPKKNASLRSWRKSKLEPRTHPAAAAIHCHGAMKTLASAT